MSTQRADPHASVASYHPATGVGALGIGAQIHPPLVIDVDGTLARGDFLWEGLVQLCSRRPGSVPALLRSALRGKAALKEFVARETRVDISSVPLEPAALRLIEEARAEGRLVILASGAHETHVAALGARVQADMVWGSDGTESLTGAAKLKRIRAHFEQFDYVGNSMADLPLLTGARRAFAVNMPALARWRARRRRVDLVVLAARGGILGALVRALRPHQWAKNALLLLPALAAHLTWTSIDAVRFAAGFFAFSMLASAVYLVNDVIDLPHDRQHETKRNRPVAAGELSIPLALAAAGVACVLAVLAAATLPARFQGVLVAYFLVASAYSLVLKRRALVDVMVLAMLYASRVVAGAAIVAVPLSRWFVAFSIFFFLSLALAKRVVELRAKPPADPDVAASRGYLPSDLPILTSLGASAAAASSLVYCLYITETPVIGLYAHPDLLWLGLPVLLYWQARVWLLTARGTMHDDPVVFALRDRTSYALFAAFLLVVAFAS
jgi:4-hydroxybenzoate polyprenyltransferase/phosphoserine phosphatase